MKVTVYQIPGTHKNFREYGFTSYADMAKASGKLTVPRDRYELVWRGTVKARSLDEIYWTLNRPDLRPEDFRGRSLSVSDLVEIDRGPKKPKELHYVDSVGCVRVRWDPEEVRHE